MLSEVNRISTLSAGCNTGDHPQPFEAMWNLEVEHFSAVLTLQCKECLAVLDTKPRFSIAAQGIHGATSCMYSHRRRPAHKGTPVATYGHASVRQATGNAG